MSGPALSQLSAHHAIHDAAFQEAEELTGLLADQLKQAKAPLFFELAEVLLEHWETRTLRHAAIEEQEFYSDIETHRPELQETIVRLRRDHHLLRTLASDIRPRLAAVAQAQAPDQRGSPLDPAMVEAEKIAILARFQAMLCVNQIHSRDEEQQLVQVVEQTRGRTS